LRPDPQQVTEVFEFARSSGVLGATGIGGRPKTIVLAPRFRTRRQRRQRFAPQLPSLEAGHELEIHDVLIAGGGPVGLTTALGLALRGVRTVIIEADDSVCEGSRAACISRRSLEILDRLGVSATFLGKGLPWTTGRSYYREREVLVFSMPNDETLINLEQYYIEQYLLDEIARLNAASADGRPLVEMRWASRVTDFAQDARGMLPLMQRQTSFAQGSKSEWVVHD
jgi:3-(3-hydroxy-phenyl)propionate hydroxylase